MAKKKPSKKLRPITLWESMMMILMADRIRKEQGDNELALMFEQVAGGDDSVLPKIYDHLLSIGKIDLADRLRKLMGY